VTLGAIVTDVAGSVSVTAAQGISDDRVEATTGITANTISLSAAGGGVSSDIGSSPSPVTIAGVGTGGAVALTIAKNTAVGAIDASNVYIASSDTVVVNAAAVD
jgi:hypothetical protein